MNRPNLTIKIADQPWELEEVCRLNHQTFSEEIEQHERTTTGLLVDKFHSENQYIICLDESELIGMIALRDVRPFSLDTKLDNIDDFLPPHQSLCEIRLLAVKPQYRSTLVFYQLFKAAFALIIKKKYDIALISGILKQQKLYRGIGFVPFGPLVGNPVKFQPMYATADFFSKSRHNALGPNQQKRVNALPGPVDIKDIVTNEFQTRPYSHRSELFTQNYKRICHSLCQFVNANNVQLFTGSGTLANEVAIAHLSALSQKGLIVSNGEFGNRIIHQAQCQKVNFTAYKVALGLELNIYKIEQCLNQDTEIKWLYMVHCETSSGVLNDLNEIVNRCSQRNIKVLVDCVSTIGIVPLDLSKVYMATASSGKAIGSFSGLSMVFFNDLQKVPENSIPVYLDIWRYIKMNGIPFTLNSNALHALGVAVETKDVQSGYHAIKEKTLWLRNQISQLSPDIVPLEGKTFHPAIITIKLPASICSTALGTQLEAYNISINFNSDYLVKQNMIQICLFSDPSDNDLQYFMSVMKSIISPDTNRLV